MHRTFVPLSVLVLVFACGGEEDEPIPTGGPDDSGIGSGDPATTGTAPGTTGVATTSGTTMSPGSTGSSSSSGGAPTGGSPTGGASASTAGSSGSSSGGGDGGGFVMPPSDEGGAAGGMYGECPCTGGDTCITADPPNNAMQFCAALCAGPMDPSGCPTAPSGDAEVICINVADMSGANANWFCALGCGAGQTCPDGMMCIEDSHLGGPITLCF